MKNKKAKKLAKFIFNEVKRYENENTKCVQSEDLQVCDYDADVSEKFFEFVCNLVKLQGKIDISINSESISLCGDLSQFKNSNSNSKSYKDDYIDIRVTKKGFKIIKSYETNIHYEDTSIFDRLKPILIDEYRNSSKDKMSTIIDDIMVLTKLSRDSNLDKILNS